MLARTVVLAAACGCGADVTVVDVPLEPQHGAAVLHIEHQDDTSLVSIDPAIRNDAPIVRSFADWRGDPIRLTVARYEASFEDLALPGPGTLTSAGSGRPLPAGDLLERVVDEAGGQWAFTDRTPRAMTEFRYGDTCRTFGSGWQEPIPEEVRFYAGLARMSDGSAVMIARASLDRPLFYRVTLDGMTQIPTTFERRVTFALQGLDDRIYLLGGSDQGGPTLYAAGDSLAFEEVAHVDATFGSFQYPNVSVFGDDGVLWSLSRFGTLWRLEGGSWEEVHDFSPMTSINVGALTWLGPEVVLVVDPDANTIHRYDDGVVTREPTQIDATLGTGSDSLYVIRHIEGVGTFAGAHSGTILSRNEAGQWTIIQDPALVSREIHVAHPFGTGLLFAGRYGLVDQYYAEEGFCDEQRFRAGNDIAFRELIQIEGGLFFRGEREVDGPNLPLIGTLRLF